MSTKESFPECVFLEGVKCRVRAEIQSSSRVEKLMEPFKKFDDRAVAMQIGKDMMKGVLEALGYEWASLAAFCHICPTLREEVDRRFHDKMEKLKPPLVSAPSTPSRGEPLTEQVVPAARVVPIKEEKPIMVVGHDLILEKKPETKPIVDFVQGFTKLSRASKDVLVFSLNRLSLWKCAEKHTPDDVIEFLKQYAKTAPSDSLKRWIFRTMSEWGSLKIVSEDNYEVLDAIDEKVLDRVLAMREAKNHIFRRLTPTRARIIIGHRGNLKQILIEKGYPVKDLARYEEFEPIRFELKPEVTADRRYEEYQKEAVEEFLKYGAGTVILPGGSGKTVIAVIAAAALKAPTLVLATRAEICEQFKREFLEKTTISPYYVSLIHGQTSTSKRDIKPITITTYQMATGALASRLWNRKWGLIIYDESQHVPSRVWSRTTRIQATRRLGLTACIHGSTKILTGNGWREVRSINPSAVVYALSNLQLETREAFVSKAKWSDRYPLQVETMSGKSIILTNDHPLLTLEDFKPKFKRAETLKAGDLVATTTLGPFAEEDEIYQLLGFAYGDGNLRLGNSVNDLRLVFTVASSEKDAIIQALNSLGCKARVDKKGQRNAYNIEVLRRGSRLHLPTLFCSLGYPIGNKLKQPLTFPRLPRKRVLPFISGLFGAEGYTPKLRKRSSKWKSKSIDSLGLRMNTEKTEWLLPFFQRVSQILSQSGVSNWIRIKTTAWGTKSLEIRVHPNLENAKRFLHLISFAYSHVKQHEANKVLAFILAKNILKKRRLKMIKEAKANRTVLWAWARGLHSDVQIRNAEIPQISTTSEIRWEEVADISVVEQKEDIYDLRVPEVMNFVANGFISHNTPIREDKQERLIFSLIGPPCFEKGWLEMAEEGFIARAKAYEILVDMSDRYARRYAHSTNEREKYVLASTNPSKYPVIERLLEKHKDDKVLILGYYVQGALEIGKKFDIPVIHGEVSHSERHRLYEQFRKDEINRLVLTSVGEEGVDLPDANVLIEVCALYGSRMAMGQRFGRILRPKEGVSVFYELVSRGTSEQDFSNERRQFLISKGYEFEEVNA